MKSCLSWNLKFSSLRNKLIEDMKDMTRMNIREEITYELKNKTMDT